MVKQSYGRRLRIYFRTMTLCEKAVIEACQQTELYGEGDEYVAPHHPAGSDEAVVCVPVTMFIP